MWVSETHEYPLVSISLSRGSSSLSESHVSSLSESHESPFVSSSSLSESQ